MNIDLRCYDSDYGAYGLVVFLKNQKKAVKIFNKTHSRKQAENVFKSECGAYIKAQKCSKIKSLIPSFHGQVTVSSILDSNGVDITGDYFTEFAYAMEFINGNFKKIGEVGDSENERITQLFSTHGINYIIDSSVVLDAHGRVEKVIDFALESFELHW